MNILVKMDANQFKQLMDHQMRMVEEMIKGMSTSSAQMVAQAVSRATAAANVPAQSSQVPLPSPLVLEGDMEENMDFFREKLAQLREGHTNGQMASCRQPTEGQFPVVGDW